MSQIQPEATTAPAMEGCSLPLPNATNPDEKHEVVALPATLPWYYPHCCGRPLFRGNPEALGWALDVLGRTLTILSMGAFVMPALLRLATKAAGCESLDCDQTIYGIRPSSLLTTVHTIVSVGAAPLMPLVGAFVDYTPHRRLIGRIMSTIFCLLLIPQIFVSEQTWFAVAIVQIVLFFIFLFQSVSAYAYLPELTDDEQALNDFTRNFTVSTFAVVVVYIAVIVGVTTGLGVQQDATRVARIAISTSAVICITTLGTAWTWLFQKRPPLQELPEGRSIWTAGFVKLYRTCCKIVREYRALKWFYIAIAVSDGAIQSLMTIMITFLSEQLQFTSADIGVGVLILLLANVPAGFISGWWSRRFNPIYSSLVAVTILLIVTATAAGVLQGPGQNGAAYALIFVWGLGIGWKWTCDRMLACAIIPADQNAEFMGIYLFFGSILTWLPPLIFTSLNEAGISMRIGLASVAGFFLVAMFAYAFMGNYRAAVEMAQGVLARAARVEMPPV